MSKCNDCGFEFSKYSIGGTSYHVDCPALKKRLVPMENNESVVEALTTELKQLRNIIAFYEIEIMPDGSFTSPRITQNEVDVKQLREFVGAMRPGSAIFTKGGAILCGGDGNWYTDHHGKFDSAIDAYRKMKAGEGE